MNLRVARELNCDMAVSTLETGPVSDSTSSYRGGLESSIHSMTATLSRMRSPPRRGGTGHDYPMPPPALATAFGVGMDTPVPVSVEPDHHRRPSSGGDVDDRVAIIISLQGEVERLEEQLSRERTARAELVAHAQEEDARRQEAMAALQQQQERGEEEQEQDDDVSAANSRLVRENTELREKLLRATRVLGRLRYRRKEMEHLE